MKRSRVNPVSDKRKKRNEGYPAIRQAVLARDGHCQFPDCTVDADWCEVHHILSGGGDGMDNLVTLCDELHGKGHHQWAHMNRREAEQLGLRESSVRVNT